MQEGGPRVPRPARLRVDGICSAHRVVEQHDILADHADLAAQADPDTDTTDLLKRYPKAQARDFDGDPSRLTEMDALVAYLQMIGTLVDVDAARPQESLPGQVAPKEEGR